MSDDGFRPLDPERPYYRWGEYLGKLSIESECCADSFSVEEEEALRVLLNERRLRRIYGTPK